MWINQVSGGQKSSSLAAWHRLALPGLARLPILCLLLSTLLTSGCAWLDARERQAIYRPTPSAAGDLAGLRTGDVRYFVTVPPSAHQPIEGAISPALPHRLELWWLPHPDPQAPTLLYLHGTFRNLPDNLHKINALREAGFAVLAVDYRGWGQSTPIIPSEQSIVQDANLAWAELVRHELRPTQRVIYGHSMGSAVAVELASHLAYPDDYGALILESAFTSFADVAREAGLLARVVAFFSHERFASIEKIAKVRAPLLMLHGAQDATVPSKLGQHLFEAANPPKQWLLIEGGQHSDLDLVAHAPYQAALQTFRQRYLPKP